MELNDSFVIPAAPDLVFAALNDPVILRGAIPGCEALERAENDSIDASSCELAPSRLASPVA